MRICWANCSGVLPTGSAPWSINRLRISGRARIFSVAWLSRSMIGRGVPAGAIRPFQAVTVNPFSPASSAVGTSGAIGTRLSLATASARSLPDCTCGHSGGMLSINTVMCPATRSATAGPVPLYGTCCMRRPAIWFSSSPASWAGVPLPGEPKVTCPLCVRA
ncbi:hypothetical protein D3C72_1721870 [compost metagenome]